MVGYRAGMGKVLVAHDNFQKGLICASECGGAQMSEIGSFATGSSQQQVRPCPQCRRKRK